ncbi:MAG: BRO-N domain-containing protein [Thermoguttaceae bacterium]
MGNAKSIKLFEQKEIRTHWDAEQEKWYFSITDVCGVLADSDNPRKYWSVLKTRLLAEGSELATNCSQLKMVAEDGKMRLTDVADTEQLLRLIQSIPSKKAEPFKMWLARVGSERIDETADPELTIERALITYQKKGYSQEWINQRLKSIEVRKDLTDEWDNRGEICRSHSTKTRPWREKVAQSPRLHGCGSKSLRGKKVVSPKNARELGKLSPPDDANAIECESFR